MGKLLVLALLVYIFECNGQILDISGFAKAGQRQAQGALGFASNILGGVSSGFGLNFGGQFGFNTQKRPEQNYDGGYPNGQQSQEGLVENQQYENNYVPQKPNHNGYRPQRPPQNHHHHQRPEPPPQHNRPGEYGPGYQQQGQQHGYENQYNNQNYYNNQRPGQPPHPNRPKKPGRPSQHQNGNFNNNGNYGNAFPNNQNPVNNPGYQNQGFNNYGSPENEGNYNNQGYGNNNPVNPNTQTMKPITDSSNTPGYGSNVPYDENNQEYLNNIQNVFGNNPQYPNNGLNSGNSQTTYGGGLVSGTLNPYNEGLNSATQNPNNGGFTLGNQNQFNNNPYNTPTSSNPFSQPDKGTEGPKEDLPTFIPLNTMDIKRETEVKPATAEDEEFSIDIRVKEDQ